MIRALLWQMLHLRCSLRTNRPEVVAHEITNPRKKLPSMRQRRRTIREFNFKCIPESLTHTRDAPAVRNSKTSTPKGNGVLTPQPAPTRESETFGPNHAHRRLTFRTPKGTEAKQRHLTFWVARRKPHETLGKTKKRREGYSRRFLLTGRAAKVRRFQKAPRKGLST